MRPGIFSLILATGFALGSARAQTPNPQGKATAPANKSPAQVSKAPAPAPGSATKTAVNPPPAKAAVNPPPTKAAPPASKTAAPPTKTASPPPTKAAGTATPASKAPGQAPASTRPSLTIASGDTMTPPPVLLREVFEYQRAGRRDPFVSLLATNDLRPTLDELTYMGCLCDPTGGSVAILHDANSKQYRARIGSQLGRMRVTAIRPKAVIFTIEEFGANRKDSLVLNDSTKTRRP